MTKALLGVSEAQVIFEQNGWTDQWASVEIETDCKLNTITVMLIAVASLFGLFLMVLILFLCCCVDAKSRAQGERNRKFSLCCLGRWAWDIVLALLHLLESTASLFVITVIYTQKPADLLGTPTSSQPLFITAITTYSLWLVVCPVIALIPCLRSTCAGCCSGHSSGHRVYVAPRSNNNGKGGGGGAIIILLLIATAPLWIWMGYNFVSVCGASIYGENAETAEDEEDREVRKDRRWSSALEAWLRSQKAHAGYFFSCLGTVFLLVIEVVGLAVVHTNGNLVHPVQHLSISLKVVSLVCKAYCLCAGSLQFKAALFKYSLVLFDLFSFLYALVALSEFFSQSPAVNDDGEDSGRFHRFFSLMANDWSSISLWWVRVLFFKIAYIGLLGGVCQVVWWKNRLENNNSNARVNPLCWLWSTFLTVPMSVISFPLLECAKLSWLLLPLHRVEPELQNCIVHLDTLNLVADDDDGSSSSSYTTRLQHLQTLHLGKIDNDMEEGKRILSPFLPCFLVLSPYFLAHLFSCLFPLLHLISAERSSNPYLIVSFLMCFLAATGAGCLTTAAIRYTRYCVLFCHNRLSNADLVHIEWSLRTFLAKPSRSPAALDVNRVTTPQSDLSRNEVQERPYSLQPRYYQKRWDAWRADDRHRQ